MKSFITRDLQDLMKNLISLSFSLSVTHTVPRPPWSNIRTAPLTAQLSIISRPTTFSQMCLRALACAHV